MGCESENGVSRGGGGPFLPEPFYRTPQSFQHADFRAIAQRLGRPVHHRLGEADVAFPGWTVDRRRSLRKQALQEPCQLKDGDGDTASDVEYPSGSLRPLGRQQVCPYDISDIDEVPALVTLPVNGGRLALQHGPDEGRNHGGAGGTPPRPEPKPPRIPPPKKPPPPAERRPDGRPTGPVGYPAG